MSTASLHALARQAGLIVEWQHVDGTAHVVAPDTLRAALGALQLPAETSGDVEESLKRLKARQAPELLTVSAGMPMPLSGRLMLESGEILDVEAGFAIDLPGYHHLETDGGIHHIAVAPAQAPTARQRTGQDRAWGPAVQIYSLRGDGGTGFGDVRALKTCIQSSAAAGAHLVAINPVHALFVADPRRISPYAPSNRDMLNPLYAEAGSGGRETGDLIDWPVAAASKLAHLRARYDAFHGDADFEAFAQDSRVSDHCLFDALSTHFVAHGLSADWSGWPRAYQDPDSADVKQFAATHAEEIRFQLYLQWRTSRGLSEAQAVAKTAGMGIGLVADLAVGVDPFGSHSWARRSELLGGLTLGAPPDAFQARGQGWGITSFSPAALCQSGFVPFLETVRKTLSFAGGMRIDHALGLERLWVIPEGADPSDGVYLRQPFDDLVRLLVLEAHRHGAIIIAEDLGTVPPGFRDRMIEHHLLGMRVTTFERDAQGDFVDPATWTPQAVAMTSTHDLIPIAGWWSGADIDWRKRLNLTGESEKARSADRTRFWAGANQPAPTQPLAVVDKAVEKVAQAACELAIVAVEDLLGETQAPNMPGTIDEHPNWRRRLPRADIFADPAVVRRTAMLSKERPQ